MNDGAVRQMAWSRRLVGGVFLLRTTALANLLPFPLAHVDGLLYGWPQSASFVMAWHGLVFPSWLTGALAIARTVLALSFLVGWWPFATGLATVAAALLVQAQDPFALFYTLELLYLAVAVHAVSRRGETALVRALVVSVYLWSAVAKLHSDWWSGFVLTRLVETHQVTGHVGSWLLGDPARRLYVARAVPGVEASLGLLVATRRSPRVVITAAIIFHVGMEEALRPDVIGLLMGALLAATWPPRSRTLRG